MTISNENLEYLQSLVDKPNEDDVRYKEIIKQKLIEDENIIYLLHNLELEGEEAEPSEYLGVNILPYYLIEPTQHNVKNFICFETSFNEVSRYNSIIKYQQIIFYVLCHIDDLSVQDVPAARHDLISAVLIDKFQGSNILGLQLKLISDKPSTTDTNYATRTLIFEQYTLNSVTDKDGIKRSLRYGR